VKVIVIGGTGTIGSAVSDALQGRHEVIAASRRGDPHVDLADSRTIARLFGQLHDVDAGAMVNAGLEAFVRSGARDLRRGLRMNAVSPGWVAETVAELGMDAAQGTPAAEVARGYVAAVEGTMTGEILRAGAGR
jgi:NAD(P)-dependent dehydrogenase (short-subunit alcohol dehydrogenase family)